MRRRGKGEGGTDVSLNPLFSEEGEEEEERIFRKEGAQKALMVLDISKIHKNIFSK